MAASDAGVLNRYFKQQFADCLTVVTKHYAKEKLDMEKGLTRALKIATLQKKGTLDSKVKLPAEVVAAAVKIMDLLGEARALKKERDSIVLLPWEAFGLPGAASNLRNLVADFQEVIPAAQTAHRWVVLSNKHSEKLQLDKKGDWISFKAPFQTKTVPRNEWAFRCMEERFRKCDADERKVLAACAKHAVEMVYSGGTTLGCATRLATLYRRDEQAKRTKMIDPVQVIAKGAGIKSRKEAYDLMVDCLRGVMYTDGYSLKNLPEDYEQTIQPMAASRCGLPHWNDKTGKVPLLRNSVEGQKAMDCDEKLVKQWLAAELKREPTVDYATLVKKFITDPIMSRYVTVVASNKTDRKRIDELDSKGRIYYIYPGWFSRAIGKIFSQVVGEPTEESSLYVGTSMMHLGFHERVCRGKKLEEMKGVKFCQYGDDVLALSFKNGVLTLVSLDLSGCDQSVHYVWGDLIAAALLKTGEGGSALRKYGRFLIQLWGFISTRPRVCYPDGLNVVHMGGVSSGTNWTTQVDTWSSGAAAWELREMEDAGDFMEEYQRSLRELGFYPKKGSVVVGKIDVTKIGNGEVARSEVPFLGNSICVKNKGGTYYLVPRRSPQDSINSLINMSAPPKEMFRDDGTPVPATCIFAKYVMQVSIGVMLSSCGCPVTYNIAKAMYERGKNVCAKNGEGTDVRLTNLEVGFEEVSDVYASFPPLQYFVDMVDEKEAPNPAAAKGNDGAPAASAKVEDINEAYAVVEPEEYHYESVGVSVVQPLAQLDASASKESKFKVFAKRMAQVENPLPLSKGSVTIKLQSSNHQGKPRTFNEDLHENLAKGRKSKPFRPHEGKEDLSDAYGDEDVPDSYDYDEEDPFADVEIERKKEDYSDDDADDLDADKPLAVEVEGDNEKDEADVDMYILGEYFDPEYKPKKSYALGGSVQSAPAAAAYTGVQGGSMEDNSFLGNK